MVLAHIQEVIWNELPAYLPAFPTISFSLAVQQFREAVLTSRFFLSNQDVFL
jgi:hypothetical protein